MVLRLKTEQSIYNGALDPGARRTGDWELTYVAEDVLELMAAYRRMKSEAPDLTIDKAAGILDRMNAELNANQSWWWLPRKEWVAG